MMIVGRAKGICWFGKYIDMDPITLTVAGAVVTSAASMGYAFASRTLGKRKEKKNQHLEGKVRELEQDLADIISGSVTKDHVRRFLVLTGISHDWKYSSARDMEWDVKGGLITRDDSLVTETCRKCGIYRTRWEKGRGNTDHAELAGFWFNNQKLDEDDQKVQRCIKPAQ